MVSYYNSLSYSQKHAAPNLTYPSAPHQPWFSPNYHPATANQQFLSGMDHPQHHQPMYYNPHHMFHQTAAAADLYARENFQNLSSAPLAHSQMFSLQQNQQQHSGIGISGGGGGSSSSSVGGGTGSSSSSTTTSSSSAQQQQQHQHLHNHHLQNLNHHHHHQQQQQQLHHHHQQQHGGNSTHPHGSNGSTGGNSPLDETSSSADLLTEGMPSPPITNVSGNGSEISSPGIPNAASSPQIQAASANSQTQNRPTPTNSPYYDWMKKPAYASQPNPGKTRTKDKYRVVYTDFQRLELEKEYHTSRYITIRRKTELAQGLQLSERQVKIWFQNRRAKERKQTKKRDDPSGTPINTSNSGGSSNGGNGNGNNCIGQSVGGISAATADELVNFMETKPKLEAGLHHHLPHHHHHHQQHSFHHHQMMSMPPPTISGLQVLHHHGHLAAAAATVASAANSTLPATSVAQHMQHVY